MLLKKQVFFIILLLANILAGKEIWATPSANPFQNTWHNDYGNVMITKCKEMKCNIKINTVHGMSVCELTGELTVLSNTSAVFQVKNLDTTENFLPVKLSLSKHIITVSAESDEIRRNYCDRSGDFEAEYMDSNMPQTYKTSFNCDKAKTKIELAICYSKELAYADTVLSELYMQLKTKQFEGFMSQQKEWIKERDLCSKAHDLNQCVSDKYRERILALQQYAINNHAQFGKVDVFLPYNFEYLLTKNSLDVFLDPPLQHYLKANLPKDIFEKILLDNFYRIEINEPDDTSIVIKGIGPGAYAISVGILILTKDRQTWLAYVDYNDKNERQIIIMSPKNADLTAIPIPLRQWVDSFDYKDIIYKKWFSDVIS